jgi:hypothetical protein
MGADLDFRDLLLEAYADFEEILGELLEELEMPQMVDALRMRWMTLADEVKEQVKDEYPEMYAKIMEMSGGEPDAYRPVSNPTTGGNYGTGTAE